MSADKDVPCAPPCFTVTVIPAEETLEAYLTRNGAKLTVFYVESQQLWELEAPRMGATCCSDKTLEGAIDKLCRVISGCIKNTKLIPGDIVSKIMASLPSTKE